MVENISVTALDRRTDAFELRLATGECVKASKVVMLPVVSRLVHSS